MSEFSLPDLMMRHLRTVFGEKNSVKRSRAIEEIYSKDCVCLDYKSEIAGQHDLNAKIDALYVKYPTYEFSPAGEPDAHHDVARMHWKFGPPGAPPAITGLDIAFVEGGQIRRLYVFLDKSGAA